MFYFFYFNIIHIYIYIYNYLKIIFQSLLLAKLKSNKDLLYAHRSSHTYPIDLYFTSRSV